MQSRMQESVADLFAMHWPYKQQLAGRGLRQSVLHDRWQALGAVFGVTGGLERGLWFAQNEHEKTLPYSVGAQSWQTVAEREAAVLASGTALLDLAAFAKFDLVGSGTLAFLQAIAPADIDVAAGRCVYTTLLNDAGGIEADVTITRVADQHFRLTSGGATRWRDLAMLRRAAKAYQLSITDVTEKEVVLGVMGAGARALLAGLSADNWHDFSFARSRLIKLDGISSRATRLSYIGAPGWEIGVPTDDAATVFDALIHAGARPLGQHALNSCRIEKRFVHWGHDIGPEISPLEAGLDRNIDWGKAFIGKAALQRQLNEGIFRRLCLLQVSGDPLLLHDELIYSGNRVVGATTSGTLGVRCKMPLAIGLIDTEKNETLQSLANRSFEIDVAGRRYDARVLERLPHDPDNEYMRQ